MERSGRNIQTENIVTETENIETQKKRICKKCFLRDLALEDQKDLQKYLNAIKKKDRVEDAVYEARLAVCRECEKLTEATCEACGCYVEFRAIVRHSRCPHKKW